ncbi:MAG TPA: CPBP family glutamic-type intramembrane protease [Polyangiales bacterium]
MFASSQVFAIVQPPLSFVPVFLMAACAATVFELSGSLFASVLTHMIYNGIVAIAAVRGGQL